MASNRVYTGLVCTPSSMSWLIGERSRIKGQLDRCRKQFDELPAKIDNLEFLLASIDGVIPMHEVKVDPLAIVDRRPQRRTPVPHGSFTKFLLKALKEAKVLRPRQP